MELYLNFEGHAETEESPNESYETHSPRGGATSQGQLAPKPATLVCAASYEARSFGVRSARLPDYVRMHSS